MPSKSTKQRAKMAILRKQGKISEREWDHFKHVKKPNRKRCGGKRGK